MTLLGLYLFNLEFGRVMEVLLDKTGTCLGCLRRKPLETPIKSYSDCNKVYVHLAGLPSEQEHALLGKMFENRLVLICLW